MHSATRDEDRNRQVGEKQLVHGWPALPRRRLLRRNISVLTQAHGERNGVSAAETYQYSARSAVAAKRPRVAAPINGVLRSLGEASRSSCGGNKVARETGLEPAASAVTGRRSNQLSYSRNRKRAPLEERAATRRDLRGRPPRSQVRAPRQTGGAPAERRLGRVEEVELADRRRRCGAGCRRPSWRGNRSSAGRRTRGNPGP